MVLHTIRVKNFRLLADIELELEAESTLIVGRNNSGKTSLTEVVRRLVESDSVGFRLEDFSAVSYDDFVSALAMKNSNAADAEIRAALPAIEVRLLFRYSADDPDLGALGELIVDLDPASTEAMAVLQYSVNDGAIDELFQGMPEAELSAEQRQQFFKALKERIPKLYRARLWAEDPNDPENQKDIDRSQLKSVLRTGFINAQRGLDDITSRENDVLSKVLEELFATATSDGARKADKLVADALTDAVQGIQTQIEEGFSIQLKGLLPTLQTFGYPGLGGPELATETTLDVKRLLKDATRVRYEGQDGILMPEAYNGLGVRNLIYVLLRIVSFYRAYQAADKRPGVHLVFIEEPEAHLHPQMQEVFIRQLAKIAKRLSEADGEDGAAPEPWPVQFIVSTHSSHVANATGFESIRYFLPKNLNQKGRRRAEIKDLSVGLKTTPAEQKNFLHQYLTLTRCDLFFADKAILVEGTTERLMLPKMVDKLEEASPDAPKLSRQYLTIMEVGGAYAQLFFPLLDFLEVPTLVITDIDSVGPPDGKACPVSEGNASSNSCLNAWFGGPPNGEQLRPQQLIAKPDADKVRELRRVSFQIPEAVGGPCGRSFEDAFMLANREAFEIVEGEVEELESSAWRAAKSVKKSQFALKYAIDETEWQTPLYIREGLAWLAAHAPLVSEPVELAPDEVADVAAEAAAEAPELANG